jgi:hypothetical protein
LIDFLPQLDLADVKLSALIVGHGPGRISSAKNSPNWGKILKFRKSISVTIGTGIAASAALVAISASPAAAESTCTTWKSSNGGTAFAKCTGGNTRFSVHRVVAVCIGPTGSKFTVEGNWANTRDGETSHAVCSSNPQANSVGVFSMRVVTDEPV